MFFVCQFCDQIIILEGIQVDVDICIVGAGLAGLASAIALGRIGKKKKEEGWSILVCEKSSDLQDPGSGMSVIGHSLVILRSLGVDLDSVGLPQTDVSLRGASVSCERVYQVPLDHHVDAELAKDFGSVQYNCHRGALQKALLHLFQNESCGNSKSKVLMNKKLRLVDLDSDPDWALAVFDDQTRVRSRLLIGADGVHSACRPFVFRSLSEVQKLDLSPSQISHQYLRDSGYSCWRGILRNSEKLSAPLRGTKVDAKELGRSDCMFKTVVSPPARSFTSGVCPPNERFWVLDVGGSHRPLQQEQRRGQVGGGEDPLSQKMLSAMDGFDDAMCAVVRDTNPSDVITTDVFDGSITRLTRYSRGRLVLIGDAAHPVVHHFGQGACLAFEDVVHLSQAVVENDCDLEQQASQITSQYDSWSHWFRCVAILLLSRVCGALYMSPHTTLTHPFLRVCLAWPFAILFTFIVKILLFVCSLDVRSFSRTHFTRKQ